VKVYHDDDGEKRLIGRADVPEDVGPIYEVRLFGPASTIVEQFAIGTVTHLPFGNIDPIVERAVLVAKGQYPDILPGWQPLTS
jgi:hypothetical protein